MTADKQTIDNEAIRIGSAKLRDAILALLNGTCPATSPDPVKLPKDPPSGRTRAPKAEAAPETREEAIVRLYSQGRTYHTIARELGIESWQEVLGALRSLRHRDAGKYWRIVELHNRARGLIE